MDSGTVRVAQVLDTCIRKTWGPLLSRDTVLRKPTEFSFTSSSIINNSWNERIQKMEQIRNGRVLPWYWSRENIYLCDSTSFKFIIASPVDFAVLVLNLIGRLRLSNSKSHGVIGPSTINSIPFRRRLYCRGLIQSSVLRERGRCHQDSPFINVRLLPLSDFES